ncbi:MAG: sugar phosphate isomerase/epimerase family protein [Bacteroidota bacterium]
MINRRHFIQKTAAGALGITNIKFRSKQVQNQNQPLLKKSLKYGMIQEGDTILKKFQLVKALGFDGVELDSPNQLNREEILQAKEQTGLLIPGVVNSSHWKMPISHPDAEIREACIEASLQAIDDCKTYGGDTVLLVAGVVNEDISYLKAYERTQESIAKILPHAEEVGIKIAIENVWNNFLLSPIEAARFIDDFNSPAIGWYFDVGNIMRYGWPWHWIEVLEERIIKIDIKEFSLQKMKDEGLWQGFKVELTEGDIDWRRVNRALTKIGYQGWASAEVPGGDRTRLAEVAAGMDRIMGMK